MRVKATLAFLSEQREADDATLDQQPFVDSQPTAVREVGRATRTWPHSLRSSPMVRGTEFFFARIGVRRLRLPPIVLTGSLSRKPCSRARSDLRNARRIP